MQKLPQQLTFSQLLTKWAAIINPLLSNPPNNSTVLSKVPLASGTNVVNHKLGQPLQGWSITRQRGVAAAIYDTQDTNPTPQLTLTLVSSAAVVVDLEVF